MGLFEFWKLHIHHLGVSLPSSIPDCRESCQFSVVLRTEGSSTCSGFCMGQFVLWAYGSTESGVLDVCIHSDFIRPQLAESQQRLLRFQDKATSPSAINSSPFEGQLTASYLAFSGNKMLAGRQQRNMQTEISILICYLSHQAIELDVQSNNSSPNRRDTYVMGLTQSCSYV